jgi:hypothetical protein
MLDVAAFQHQVEPAPMAAEPVDFHCSKLRDSATGRASCAGGRGPTRPPWQTPEVVLPHNTAAREAPMMRYVLGMCLTSASWADAAVHSGGLY